MTSSPLLLVVLAGVGCAASFEGTWEGKANGQPAVQLTVRTEGKGVAGTITFFFMKRENERAEWKVAGKTVLPLLEPKVENGKLQFEVQHAKKHGGTEMGPNVRFRVEKRGADELALFRLDGTESEGPGLTLARCYLASGCAAIQ